MTSVKSPRDAEESSLNDNSEQHILNNSITDDYRSCYILNDETIDIDSDVPVDDANSLVLYYLQSVDSGRLNFN